MQLWLAGAGVVLLLVGVIVDLETDTADGWLSPMTVGAFLAVFGFTSYALTGIPSSDAVRGVAATVAAVGGVVVTRKTVTALAAHGDDPPPTLDPLLGATATVTVPITATGDGQVAATLNGTPVRLNATVEPTVVFPGVGDTVVITEITSPTRVTVTTRF